jgi:hypothetical protein
MIFHQGKSAIDGRQSGDAAQWESSGMIDAPDSSNAGGGRQELRLKK